MSRTIICLLVMAVCALWGCLDRAAQRRVDFDREFRERRQLTACSVKCNSENSECLTKKGHAQLACSQHYSDCVRDCPSS